VEIRARGLVALPAGLPDRAMPSMFGKEKPHHARRGQSMHQIETRRTSRGKAYASPAAASMSKAPPSAG
jgi:hypothetical protein